MFAGVVELVVLPQRGAGALDGLLHLLDIHIKVDQFIQRQPVQEVGAEGYFGRRVEGPEKEKIRRQALPGPLSAAAGRGLVKKSWEYLKKVLTNRGACGILIPADVRRCAPGSTCMGTRTSSGRPLVL